MVSNGVDLVRTDANRPETPSQITRTPLQAVCVATLRPIKNVETLLRALNELSASQCHLSVIGDGPSLEKLKNMSRQLGVTDRVTFHGRMSRDRVLTQLWRADLLMTASHGEGLPISVLEAMSAECHVVCSDIPAHRELDPECQHLRFASTESPSAYAQAIQDLLDTNLEERSSRAQAIREYCHREFSATQMLNKCEDVYVSILPVAQANRAVVPSDHDDVRSSQL